MSTKIRLDLTVPSSEATFLAKTQPKDTDPHMSFERFGAYLHAIAGAVYSGSAHEVTGAVNAYGLITSTGTATNGDVMTVANVTLTAKTSSADPTAGEFDISGTVAVQAANIALAINSDDDFAGIVTATSALGVVTVTSVAPGAMGNGTELDIGTMHNMSVTAFAHGVDGTTFDYAIGL